MRPSLSDLLEMRRVLRINRVLAVTLAGLSAIVGGICLYAAIDDWLRGNAFWSAVNTAVAFFNSVAFERNMQHLWVMRRVDARLRALIELDHSHG